MYMFGLGKGFQQLSDANQLINTFLVTNTIALR